MDELDKELEEQQRKFYNNFVYLCKSHHLSMRYVMSQIGQSISPVTKWKNGSWPDTRTLKKIADFFSVSLDELLGNEPAPAGLLLGANERKMILIYRKMDESDRKIIDIVLAKYED